MRSLGHLCLLLTLFAAASADGHWDYHENGPSVWGETYPTCNGELQSPILLNKQDTVALPLWLARGKDISISFHDYDTAAPSVFSNNGHTANLAFNYTSRSRQPRVVIQSSTDKDVYYLQALHFHWGSEHWIENQSYPLELHMVHRDENDEILVIGYVFQECGRRPWPWALPSLTRGSAGLAQLAALLPLLTNVGDQENLSFAPQRLVPAQRLPCGYFAYRGSLTTPPCTEGVTWLVHRDPLCVEDWQMQAFYIVLDAEGNSLEGNARPLQKRNGRPVLYLTC